jgi:hypothetical protein
MGREGVVLELHPPTQPQHDEIDDVSASTLAMLKRASRSAPPRPQQPVASDDHLL